MNNTTNQTTSQLQYKPELIFFEGVNGCGKSTLIQEVYRQLLRAERIAHITSEPYHLANSRYTNWSHVVELLGLNSLPREAQAQIYCANRIDHIVNWINKRERWNCFSPTYILCSRWIPSTIVYQGWIYDRMDTSQATDAFTPCFDTEVVRLALRSEMYLDYPDYKIFYLDVSPDLAAERLEQRGENADLDRLTHLVAGYKATMMPGCIPTLSGIYAATKEVDFWRHRRKPVVLDASLPVAELTQQVISSLLE